MIKVLVLIFGVTMFFGGFWRVTEDKKRNAEILMPEEQPTEPEFSPIEEEDFKDVEEVKIEPQPLPKALTKTRSKTKRSTKSKKAV